MSGHEWAVLVWLVSLVALVGQVSYHVGRKRGIEWAERELAQYFYEHDKEDV